MRLLIPDLRYADVPPGASVLAMKGHHQTDRYSCGFAAAVTVLKGMSICYKGKELWDAVAPCPTKGVTSRNLTHTLKSYGCSLFRSHLSRRSIMAEIDQGNPMVLSARMPWQEKGDEHWMVVAGYNTNGHDVLLLNHTTIPGKTAVWWKLRELRSAMSRPSMIVVEAHLDLLMEPRSAITRRVVV